MVESTNNSKQFENVVKTFTDDHNLAFNKLRLNLPEEQMKRAEQRVAEMISTKSELLELAEQGYVLQREFMNKIMTLLEVDEHDKLLHEAMEAYTNCFIVDKAKILALFDEDINKLNLKLENAKEYHQTTVSEID